MEIERNLVQMIRTGPPEVLGRFWAGFRRIWVGFRRVLVYNTPTTPPRPPGEPFEQDVTPGFLVIARSWTMEIGRNLVQMIRTGPPELSKPSWDLLGALWRSKN